MRRPSRNSSSTRIQFQFPVNDVMIQMLTLLRLQTANDVNFDRTGVQVARGSGIRNIFPHIQPRSTNSPRRPESTMIHQLENPRQYFHRQIPKARHLGWKKGDSSIIDNILYRTPFFGPEISFTNQNAR